MTKAQFTLCNSWTVTQRAFESTTTRAAAEGLDQRSHADSNLFVWFFFFSSFSVRLIYPTPCFLILHIMESEDEEAGRTVSGHNLNFYFNPKRMPFGDLFSSAVYALVLALLLLPWDTFWLSCSDLFCMLAAAPSSPPLAAALRDDLPECFSNKNKMPHF